MKTATIAIAAVTAATLGLSSVALADRNETFERASLDSMLDQAAAAGIESFREFDVDRENGELELDVEGWNSDGQEMELTLRGPNATVMAQEIDSTLESPWGLDRQQLNALLDRTAADGFERISELDLNRSGSIEIEGYDGVREIEQHYDYRSVTGGA